MAKEKQLPNTNIHQRSSETRTSTQLIQLINNHQVDGHKKRTPKKQHQKITKSPNHPKFTTPNNFHTHNFNPTKIQGMALDSFPGSAGVIFTSHFHQCHLSTKSWWIAVVPRCYCWWGRWGGLDLPSSPQPRKWRIFSLKRDTFTRNFHGTQASIFGGYVMLVFRGGNRVMIPKPERLMSSWWWLEFLGGR